MKVSQRETQRKEIKGGSPRKAREEISPGAWSVLVREPDIQQRRAKVNATPSLCLCERHF